MQTLKEQMEKSFMFAGPSATYTTTTTEPEKITLVKKLLKGTKFSISDGNVVVGKGVKYVKVSANVYCSSNVSGNRLFVIINKNDTTIVQGVVRSTGFGFSVAIPPRLIDVVEGDTLSLYVRTPDEVGFTIGYVTNNTQFNVEEF